MRGRKDKLITTLYKNKKIEKLFKDLEDVANSRLLLQKEVGKEKAVACKRRWDQIRSFTTFGSFLNAKLDNTEPLEGQLKGKYSITLTGNYRFIFAPNTQDYSPQNLKQITEFIVVGVMDYHGKGNKDNKWLIP